MNVRPDQSGVRGRRTSLSLARAPRRASLPRMATIPHYRALTSLGTARTTTATASSSAVVVGAIVQAFAGRATPRCEARDLSRFLERHGMSPGAIGRIQTALLVYGTGFHGVVQQVRRACWTTRDADRLTGQVWRLFAYLLGECDPAAAYVMEIGTVIRDGEQRRLHRLRHLQRQQVDVAEREAALDARVAGLASWTALLEREKRGLKRRHEAAKAALADEQRGTRAFQGQVAELEAVVQREMALALAQAAQHDAARERIDAQVRAMAALKDEIGGRQRDPDAAGRHDDLAQLKGRARVLTTAVQRSAASETMMRSRIAHGEKLLLDFTAATADLLQRVDALTTTCALAHRDAIRAIRAREAVDADLRRAIAEGAALKQEDDRLARIVVTLENEHDRLRGRISDAGECIATLADDEQRSREAIERRNGVPERVRADAHRWQAMVVDADAMIEALVPTLDRWRESNMDGEIARNELLATLRTNEDVAQASTALAARFKEEMIPEERRLLHATQETTSRVCRDMEALTKAAEETRRRQQAERERGLMSLEDSLSELLAVSLRVGQTVEARNANLEMIDVETRASRALMDRARQLDEQVAAAELKLKQEREQRNAVMARDRAQQNRKATLLARLSTKTAETRRARELIESSGARLAQLGENAADHIADLTKDLQAAAALHDDVAAVHRQHLANMQARRMAHEMEVDEWRSRSMLKRQEIISVREAECDTLAERCSQIRNGEFAYRKLNIVLSELAANWQAKLPVAKQLQEDILASVARSHGYRRSSYAATASTLRLQDDLGRLTLSYMLSSHDLVEKTKSVAAVRDQLASVVDETLPVEFTIGQFVARQYNRSRQRGAHTQTMSERASTSTQTIEE